MPQPWRLINTTAIAQKLPFEELAKPNAKQEQAVEVFVADAPVTAEPAAVAPEKKGQEAEGRGGGSSCPS